MENFDYQGRRKDQYESNSKTMAMGCIGFLGVVLVTIIHSILF